jgi:general secretion pathway protein G
VVIRTAQYRRGFTLIELLVVLAALGVLLALVVPRYVDHVERARETVLRHNLKHLRSAIDQFHADRDRYPQQLEELVAQRYLKEIPVDPITDRKDSWIMVAPQDGAPGNVRDVRSGASDLARDGSAYAAW